MKESVTKTVSLEEAFAITISLFKDLQKERDELKQQLNRSDKKVYRLRRAVFKFWPKHERCETHEMEPNTTMDYFRCDQCGLPNEFVEAMHETEI